MRRYTRIEAEKERAIQEKRWAEIRQQQSQEQARIDGLLNQVQAYRLSHDIREFVDAYLQIKLDGVTDAAMIDKYNQWALWARQQADRFDPTRPSPYSILDEKVPEAPRWR